MKLGAKAIVNNGVHGLPDESVIVLVGMSYEDEETLYVFKSAKGMQHYLAEEEFKWAEESLI